MPFSFRERERALSYLKNREWDAVVVGGGITGAAVARDAALRGMKVALVEADDFASGTSSGSSKLIHGGLRYLENFEFGLVREAIHEREKLRDLYAPFVRDLHFVFPTFTHTPPPRWKLNIGLFLYDAFSAFRARHRNLDRDQALREFPMLSADRLSGACIYLDSFAEDFRLVIELIKSAQRHSATCLSRVQVDNIKSAEGGRVQLTVRDLLNPEAAFQVRTEVVFNCAGPFSDRLRTKLGLSERLQLTQGVHFLIPREKLPIDDAFVLSDPTLHRILFAIPWGPTTYLGTTDTSIKRPEDARADLNDLTYVLRIANQYFQTKIEKSDITQSWAAVRPLIKPNADAKSNSEISREHQVEEGPTNVFHLLGGKLTSHRAMAIEAMNRLAKRRRIPPTKTDKLPLQDASWDSSLKTQPSHLTLAYGRFASDILRIDRERQMNLATLAPHFPQLVAEVVYSINEEMAMQPIDFLRRRSPLYYWTNIDRLEDKELINKVVNIFAQELGWNADQRASALEQTFKVYEHDRRGYS